jgi:selenide,water dikinase
MMRVVLAGAGHANIVALRRLAGCGLALTLVNEGPYAWYTGRLPALLRGDVPESRARIDLRALTEACDARFIEARVTGFTADRLLLGEETLGFDILGYAVGGDSVPGGAKPLPELLRRVAAVAGLAKPRIGLVGAGAAGAELACALRHLLGERAEIFLAGSVLLPGAPDAARRVAARALAAARIMRVETLPAGLDELIAAYTPAPTLRVGADLRVAGYARVFAAGDAARFEPALPRSGAVAVRQGRVLAANIARLRHGKPLRDFRPPRATLAILSLDRDTGLAWFGPLSWHGHWPMMLKNRLDEDWLQG